MLNYQNRIKILNKALGKNEVDRKGINASFKCPSCKHKDKKKFVVNIETGAYHCWVCDQKGKNIFWFLKTINSGIAVEWQQETKENFETKKFEEEKKEEKVLLPHDFMLFVDNLHTSDFQIKKGLEYLSSRNISVRDMWYFKLGFVQFGNLAKRIIIPSFDEDGELNYWTARTWDTRQRLRYMNPPISRDKFIFNEINVDWRKPLTIVEGPFDAMQCDENVVPILGSEASVRTKLFQKIIQNGTPVILALDSEKNAILKREAWAKNLSIWGIDIKILNIPKEYKDIGEMDKKTFINIKKQAEPWNRFLSIKTKSIKFEHKSIF